MHAGGRPARKNRRSRTAAGQAMPAGASREGLSRNTTRNNNTHVAPPPSAATRGCYDAAWSLIEIAHGGGREPTPGFCLCGRTETACRVPRGRSEPAPVSRVPGSSGRCWPLAQERRAARAHARPQWRPPSARGGGIGTWLAAPSHRGRQEAASAALLQVPREPTERGVEREQRWFRWRGVARKARALGGGAR